jgi:competence protein ComEC
VVLPSPEPLHPWLPWLALGVVVGAMAPMALSNRLGVDWSPQVWWWCLGAPLAVVAVAVGKHWIWAGRWLLFAAAGLLGGALGDGGGTPPPTDQVRVMAIEGMVTSVKWPDEARPRPRPEAGKSRWHPPSQGFVLQPERVLKPEDVLGPADAAPSSSAVGHGPARLFVRAEGLPAMACGDRVRVLGRWSREARGEAVDAVAVVRLERREDGARGWAWRALERLGERRALGESLILGQGDPPEKRDFRRSGLLHILAVSGTHLVIAAAFGVWLLRVIGVGWWPRQLAVAALIAGYTWLTGASPATVRSLAMGLAVIAAGLMAREPHRLAAVSLAALVLIALDPANATDVGFQLSLAAVLGLLTLGVDLVHLRQRWLPLAPWPLDRAAWRGLLFAVRAASDGLCIGFGATLATMPIVAWYFGSATPWSPLTTLLATPPTTAALWLGLPVIALGGVFPHGPWEGLYAALEASLDALAGTVRFGATLPGATLSTGAMPTWMPVAWPLLFLPLRDGLGLGLRLAAIGLLIATWCWPLITGG